MIGSYSFYQCTQLESVDLSKCSSLTTIGSFSFAFCLSHPYFIFSPSFKTIASNALRSVPLEQTIDITKITHLSIDAFPNTSLSFTCEDLIQHSENMKETFIQQHHESFMKAQMT